MNVEQQILSVPWKVAAIIFAAGAAHQSLADIDKRLTRISERLSRVEISMQTLKIKPGRTKDQAREFGGLRI